MPRWKRRRWENPLSTVTRNTHHDKHDHDKHGHDKHAKDDEAHSEFHAMYRFRCNRPAHLTYIDIHIFRQFPATRELKVQSISPHGQRAQTLTSDAAKLMF